MPKRYASRIGEGAVPHRIVIRGALAEPLVGPLAGMRVEAAGDETVLVGDIVDQAQLHGVLVGLSDLGVEIVSLHALEEESEGSS